MSNIDKIENLTIVLIESRESKGKSQRWMAKAMGKSPTTISNWEEGISIPDIIEVLTWFEVLGINPCQYMMKFLNPKFVDISNTDDDENNKKNLVEFITNVATPSIRKKLAFNLLGNTGSFFESQLDLITAHNLCTLDVKVNNAWTIFHHYIMAKNRNELLPSDVFPDEEGLNNAIIQGEKAAFNGKNGYVQCNLKGDSNK